MTTVLFAIGAAVAAVLLGLLVLTLLFRPLRIWPTPGTGSWQSYVFWPLFRSLNVLCFAVALADRGEFPRPPRMVEARGIRAARGLDYALHLFVPGAGPGQQLRRAGRAGHTGGLPLDPQSAERDAGRCLRLPRVGRRQRAGLCAVCGHDGRLRPDGAGRGAVAGGRLRRALPALLQPRAPLLQLATGGCPGAHRGPATTSSGPRQVRRDGAAVGHFPPISPTSGRKAREGLPRIASEEQ